MTTLMSLKELAKLLGLSPSTVSRALKGHPDISRATQEKVKAMAEQVNYHPNALALSLRSKHSRLIAIVVPQLLDQFYASVLSGVLHFAYKAKYKVMVFETEERYQQELAVCSQLENSGVDGVLITPAKTTIDISHFKSLLNSEIPLVFLDRVIGELDTDRVLEDDFRGAYLAVAHMIKGGCKKIAHISLPQRWVWGQKRQIGYIQALLDHHFSVNRDLIMEYQHLGQVEEITRRLVRDFQVDGIFVATDEGAIKVLNVLNDLKYAIPEQVAVCGFGNSPVSEVSCQPLTSVCRDGWEMGRIAFELLLNRINVGNSGTTVTRILKNELIVRRTTLPVFEVE